MVMSWVRIARCTEDLTFDFEPGEMLCGFELAFTYRDRYCKRGIIRTPF